MTQVPVFLPRRFDSCPGCPLENSPVHTKNVPTEVESEGRVDVIYIGECPGPQEDERGRPFIGPSGSILRNTIKQYRPENLNVAYSNVCRCFAGRDKDGKIQRPPDSARRQCLTNLFNDLRKLKPKKIVLCGGVAAGAFTTFRSIAEVHGSEIEISIPKVKKKKKALVAWHPSACQYDPYIFRYFEEDIKRSLGASDVDRWSPPGEVKVINTVSGVKRFVKWLLYKQKPDTIVAFDFETEGVSRTKNRVLSVAFAVNGHQAYVIPLDHKEASWSPQELKKVLKYLKHLWTEKPSFKAWVGHFIKFEISVINLIWKVWLDNAPIWDTAIAMYLWDENRLTLKKGNRSDDKLVWGLKQLTKEYLGFLGYDDEKVLEARSQGRLADHPLDSLLAYNGIDAYITHRLLSFVKEKNKEHWPQSERIMTKLLGPASITLACMEYNGFHVDVNHLFRLQSDSSPLKQAQRDIENKLRMNPDVQKANTILVRSREDKSAATGEGGMKSLFKSEEPWVFNVNRPESLQCLFFQVLRLKPITRTKAGKNSVNDEFLEYYGDEETSGKRFNEAAFLVRTWREINKLVTTYVNRIVKAIKNSPECSDGRIRASFGLVFTVTGRTNSKNPNLQQLVKGSGDWQVAVRDIYRASPGFILVSSDYRQGEINILPQVTGDRKFAYGLQEIDKLYHQFLKYPTREMANRLMIEGDAHRRSASILFGIPINQVTKKQRQIAKSIVSFGLIYGKSIKTLAADLGVEEEEAQARARDFFSKFPESEAGLKAIEQLAAEKFLVESPLGRIRHLPILMSQDSKMRGRALRQARNSPIQSMLSDIAMYSANCLTRDVIIPQKLNWKLVNVVHDAIIAEIPYNEVEQYIKIATIIMEDLNPIANDFRLKLISPLSVDHDIGISYGSLKTVRDAEKEAEGIDTSLHTLLKSVRKQWEVQGYKIKDKKQKTWHWEWERAKRARKHPEKGRFINLLKKAA